MQTHSGAIPLQPDLDGSALLRTPELPSADPAKGRLAVQRGLLEKYLGRANPRRYLPEALGGYTPQQRARNQTRAALRAVGLADEAVEALLTLHATRNPPAAYDHANLVNHLGPAVLPGGNALAQRVVHIVNALGAPALAGADLATLLALQAARNNLEIVTLANGLRANAGWGAARVRDLAQLPQNLAVADILTLAPLNRSPAGIGNLLAGLAGAVAAPTVAELVQLDGISNIHINALAGIAQVTTVAQLIQLRQALAVPGSRPLADLVTLAGNAAGLTVDDLRSLAAAPATNALGEFVVQDGIHRNQSANKYTKESHAANLGDRQAVLANDALRAVIRERWAGGVATAIVATLLEGSLYWPGGSGPEPAEGYQIRLGSTFASWIRGGDENQNKPAANAVSTMNCWEGVLFAGYLAGKLTYVQLTTIHNQAAQAGGLVDPAGTGTMGAMTAYYNALGQFLNVHNSNLWNPNAVPPPALPMGNIVFFTDQALPTNMDKLSHVAISLGGRGGNARLMSLWYLPGQRFRYLTVAQMLVAFPSTVYTAPCPW